MNSVQNHSVLYCWLRTGFPGPFGLWNNPQYMKASFDPQTNHNARSWSQPLLDISARVGSQENLLGKTPMILMVKPLVFRSRFSQQNQSNKTGATPYRTIIYYNTIVYSTNTSSLNKYEKIIVPSLVPTMTEVERSKKWPEVLMILMIQIPMHPALVIGALQLLPAHVHQTSSLDEFFASFLDTAKMLTRDPCFSWENYGIYMGKYGYIYI